MTDARIHLTTVGSAEAAANLARTLVERRVAACVNIIGPIRSIYRWNDAVEDQQEFLLLIKTTTDSSKSLLQALSELHPYEVPEHLELAIDGGSAAYLDWLQAQVGAKGGDQ